VSARSYAEKRVCGVRTEEPTLTKRGWGTLKDVCVEA
jgi:hypothetical protein